MLPSVIILMPWLAIPLRYGHISASKIKCDPAYTNMTSLTRGECSLRSVSDCSDDQKLLHFHHCLGHQNKCDRVPTIRSPFRNAPHVSLVAIGRTSWWNNWLITPKESPDKYRQPCFKFFATYRYLGWGRLSIFVYTRCSPWHHYADSRLGDALIYRTQYFPTFTHASDRPSIRFLSTSRIESLDQKLIAITRLTTNCAGSDRLRSSLVWVKRDRLLNCRCWDGCLERFEYITALYRWRQQWELLEMYHTSFLFWVTMFNLPDAWALTEPYWSINLV